MTPQHAPPGGVPIRADHTSMMRHTRFELCKTWFMCFALPYIFTHRDHCLPLAFRMALARLIIWRAWQNALHRSCQFLS